MKNVSFILRKKLNRLFGQPKTYMYVKAHTHTCFLKIILEVHITQSIGSGRGWGQEERTLTEAAHRRAPPEARQR